MKCLDKLGGNECPTMFLLLMEEYFASLVSRQDSDHKFLWSFFQNLTFLTPKVREVLNKEIALARCVPAVFATTFSELVQVFLISCH